MSRKRKIPIDKLPDSKRANTEYKIRQRIKQIDMNAVMGQFDMVEHITSQLDILRTLKRFGLCNCPALGRVDHKQMRENMK